MGGKYGQGKFIYLCLACLTLGTSIRDNAFKMISVFDEPVRADSPFGNPNVMF